MSTVALVLLSSVEVASIIGVPLGILMAKGEKTKVLC